MLTCPRCGDWFNARAPHQKFCSVSCKGEADVEKLRAKLPASPDDLSPSVRGSVSELVAGAYLMNKGWEVFRAFSPDASCDLIAMKGGVILRVQVKSAVLDSSGEIYRIKYSKELGRYDLLVRVAKEGKILIEDNEGTLVDI